VRTPDGSVWTKAPLGYDFWQSYLDVFDSANVVARASEASSVPPDWKRADGERVSFSALPYYVGPWQYLQRAAQVRHASAMAVDKLDAVILRTPGVLSCCVASLLNKTGHPYGVTVVGDPYEVFSPGAMQHPLRRLLRWHFSRHVRRQCTNACACSYVTEKTLQLRYPPAETAFSTHYSSVQLAETDICHFPRPLRQRSHEFTVVTVGTLAQLYKAPDVLIDAVALCVRDGLNLRLVVIGDGRHRAELESRAAAAGLGARIEFSGQLPPGKAVRTQLDKADLFVLPSRTDGLPRAMIEAMARGLPCIGSTVGGIPELLPREDLVPPDNVAALARKICEVVRAPDRMACMSSRNLEKAKQYQERILRGRRIAFCRHVKESTATWLSAKAAA